MSDSDFPIISLSNGAKIRVEATRLPGVQPTADEDVRWDGQAEFDEVFKAIEGFSEQLNKVLTSVKPKSAEVKFGIELGAESGQLTALLVKGTGKANLEITLTWGS